MDMYDEFGTYDGPELDDDSDGGSGEDQDEVRARALARGFDRERRDRDAFPFTIEQTERFFSLLFEVFWTSSPSSRPDPPDPPTFSRATTGGRVDGPG